MKEGADVMMTDTLLAQLRDVISQLKSVRQKVNLCDRAEPCAGATDNANTDTPNNTFWGVVCKYPRPDCPCEIHATPSAPVK